MKKANKSRISDFSPTDKCNERCINITAAIVEVSGVDRLDNDVLVTCDNAATKRAIFDSCHADSETPRGLKCKEQIRYSP